MAEYNNYEIICAKSFYNAGCRFVAKNTNGTISFFQKYPFKSNRLGIWLATSYQKNYTIEEPYGLFKTLTNKNPIRLTDIINIVQEGK